MLATSSRAWLSNLPLSQTALDQLLSEAWGEARRRMGVGLSAVDQAEWDRCSESPIYFLLTHAMIEDPIIGKWIPFRLWPRQKTTLDAITEDRLIVILKARQLGLTWLVLGYALWLMLFRASASVLLFSRRDTEAVYLLDDRLKGMFERLPEFLKGRVDIIDDSRHRWGLSNGSTARAFPTGTGDSYTATLAIIDEADLVPDLNRTMRAVKPTIDNGGRMILLSRSDKSQPQSEFKRLYRAAKQGLTEWTSIFLPWFVHPGRDEKWYEVQKVDVEQRTGSLDDLHEQYPATDTEALSSRTLDKRINPAWIEQCYIEIDELEDDALAIPGLRIYKLPIPSKRYIIGADPAEGNPTSDDSA